MKWLFKVFKLLNYLIKGKTKYYIHSPFVYSFVTEVLYDKRPFYCYEEVGRLRNRLKKANEIIEVNDYGAGSHTQKQDKRSISSIISTSVKPDKYAKLLFRIATYFQYKQVLEIGTSVGLTTLYLASASENSRVFTLEGSHALAEMANKNFKLLNKKNITLIEGNFNNTLGDVLEQMPFVDLVYFDGNHTREATLNYFTQCLAKAHNGSVFIVDDIYWSREMSEAWQEIKNNPRVTLTIDLYSMGLVFFRQEKTKEHFVIYF